MSQNHHFRGIASTTHEDIHGERVTREFLEQQAAMFKENQQIMWGYWNHLTTMPPTMIVTNQEVEKRDDGEYQLVVQGERFEEEYFETYTKSGIEIPTITKQDIFETIKEEQDSDSGKLIIQYDPRNFDSDEINPIIEKSEG